MKKFFSILILTGAFTALAFPQSEPADDGVQSVAENNLLEELSDQAGFTEEEAAPATTDSAATLPVPEEELKEDEESLEKSAPEKIEENKNEKPKDISQLAEDNIAAIQEALDSAPSMHVSVPLIPDEILERPEVDKFRKQYLTEKWSVLLNTYLEQGMEYRLYVRKALQNAQMPELLEYLPVVESNYKTNAKSKSGAIGMWQFMANSVWPFLTLNDFVDERLDPWKSTDGALKKLKDNYKTFNDWLIGIAAYNCGAGAMAKAIKKAKPAEGEVVDFWYLIDHKLLPSQTANYVPKLIAIADLALNPEYYGIDLPKHEEEFELLVDEREGNFDYLEVNKAYSISQLAQEMRMDEKTLKHLNPSYVLGMTHPTKKSQIRLPLGMKESAEDALSKLKPIDFPLKYTVAAGDSLWSISRRYHTTVSAICELNNIKENAILKIGKILYIPAK